MDAPNFEEYNDAKKAKRIFMAYKIDVETRGLAEKALRIVEQHKTCESLDIALDKLISTKRGHSIKPSPREYE